MVMMGGDDRDLIQVELRVPGGRDADAAEDWKHSLCADCYLSVTFRLYNSMITDSTNTAWQVFG